MPVCSTMLNAHRERREEICVCDVLTGKPGVKLSCYKVRLEEKETTDRQQRNGEKSVCSNTSSPERKKRGREGERNVEDSPPRIKALLCESPSSAVRKNTVHVNESTTWRGGGGGFRVSGGIELEFCTTREP